MTKKEKKEQKKETKKMFYGFMDKKDKVYQLMDDFKTKHRFMPEQYKNDILLMNAYDEYKRFGGWRNVPGAKVIINKAIQKFCKNKVANPETKKEMTLLELEEHLKKQTKYIFESIDKAKKELEKMRKNKEKGLDKKP